MEIMLMFNIMYFMTFMIMYPLCECEFYDYDLMNIHKLCDVVTNYVRTVESRMYTYLMYGVSMIEDDPSSQDGRTVIFICKPMHIITKSRFVT